MAYPLGQAVRISTGTITDATGAAANPATLVLTILGPSGVTDTFTAGQLAHDGTGQYHYDYLAAAPGRYSWRYVATGPDTAAQDAFDVAPLAGLSTAYLTADEFDAIPTGLDTSGIDVDGVLTRASAWADRVCRLPRGAFAQLPQTELHRATPNRCGELSLRLNGTSPNLPVTVTAVAWGARPSTLTALTSLTDVWVDGGHVTIPFLGYTGSWVGSLNVWGPAPGGSLFVQVGFTSGWATIPDDLKQAVAFLASALIITPDADDASTPFPGAAARSGKVAKSADVDYLDSAERILGFYARRTP